MADAEMANESSIPWQTRKGQQLHIGDIVGLIPMDPMDELYIARIDKMYRDEKGKRLMQIRWYYRAKDLQHAPPSKSLRNELYYTDYFDCQLLESVSKLCKVLTKSEYLKVKEEQRRSSLEMFDEDIFFCKYAYSAETGAFTKIGSDAQIRRYFKKQNLSSDWTSCISLKVLVDVLLDLEETIQRDAISACWTDRRSAWIVKVKECKTVKSLIQSLLDLEEGLQLITSRDGRKYESKDLTAWRKAVTANSNPALLLQNIEHLKDYVLNRHKRAPMKRKRYLSGQSYVPDLDKDKLKMPLLQDATSDESDRFGRTIKEGGIYQIDHKCLPPEAPIHLKCIFTVVVMEITEFSVSVKFPSNLALREYFGKEFCEGVKQNTSQSPQARPLRAIGPHPALDEQFVMDTRTTERLFVRQISSSEYAQQRHLESFWLVQTKADCPSVDVELRTMQLVKADDTSAETNRSDEDPKTLQIVALESDGDADIVPIRWGRRRKVTFNRKHRRSTGKDEEQTSADNDLAHVLNRPVKRACLTSEKREKASMLKLMLRLPKEMQGRWTSERYKSAQLRLLDIMHEKEAIPGRPILRPSLREEARKHIGDTGLLDHLLKHMTDTVIANGERFRRRHNADGAMEYWLEPAGLMEIRKQAGIQDPFWIPPPGWKPGDKLPMNGGGMTPEEAVEMKSMKEELAHLKSELLLMKRSNMKGEAPVEDDRILKEKLMEMGTEIADLRKYLEELEMKFLGESKHILLSKRETTNSDGRQTSPIESSVGMKIQAGAKLYGCSISDRLQKLESDTQKFFQEMETKYTSEKQSMESQCSKLSKGLEIIQEEMKTVKRFVGKTHENGLAATQNAVKNPSSEPSLSTLANPSEMACCSLEKLDNTERRSGESTAFRQPSTVQQDVNRSRHEQQSRTGFRLCKPEGTFVWPNMAPKTAVRLPLDDVLSSRLPPGVEPPTSSTENSLGTTVDNLDKDKSPSLRKDFSLGARISSAVVVQNSPSVTGQLSPSSESASHNHQLLQPQSSSSCWRQNELISSYMNHLTAPRVPWAHMMGSQIGLERPPLSQISTTRIMSPALTQASVPSTQAAGCHVGVPEASPASRCTPQWLGLAPPDTL